MSLQKQDKIFWICVTALASFTLFIDQELQPQIAAVSAQVEKNTRAIGSIDSMQSDIHDIKMQLQQQTQDIADIKAQLKTFH